MIFGWFKCSRCGGNDGNCNVCHEKPEPMKARYYRKGGLIWRFLPGLDEPNAFVRIIDSAEGWTESVMAIEDMAGSNALEISEEEGEP
jgi:hypothetical protein